MSEKTIAAISSGLTKSGIGIIRVSGPDSRRIVESIFGTRSGRLIRLSEPMHIYYGFVRNVSRETSDEVLVLNMPAPRSFTGEDTVEIDCHGGILMMRRVLEAVLDAGAVNAEPGEFTKRAFLNGRMDLSQAEAVIDIINAENDNAIRSSVSQLNGGLSSKIRSLREILINNTAYIESALDDPEHYSLDGCPERISSMADEVHEEVEKLIVSYDRGRVIRGGIETVIIGLPNAGKSSLLNAMLGEERAIVTQIPGTTRDTVTETISLGNLTLRLSDTAGIRESQDLVESIGIQKALDNADRAELLLCVIDASEELDDDLKRLIYFADSKKARTIYLLNKNDRELRIHPEDIRCLLDKKNLDSKYEKVPEACNDVDGVEYSENKTAFSYNCNKANRQAEYTGSIRIDNYGRFEYGTDTNAADSGRAAQNASCSISEHDYEIIEISAEHNRNIDDLFCTIEKLFEDGCDVSEGAVIVCSARHYELLRKAAEALMSLKQTISSGLPEDFYTVDMMDAYSALGEIIGEETDEDLINEIFAKFCMGK